MKQMFALATVLCLGLGGAAACGGGDELEEDSVLEGEEITPAPAPVVTDTMPMDTMMGDTMMGDTMMTDTMDTM